MPFKIDHAINPTEIINRIETKLGLKTPELRAWGNAVVKRLRTIVTEQFATQGARSGPPWPSLSDKYASWKRRMGKGSAPLLVLTGTLQKGIKINIASVNKVGKGGGSVTFSIVVPEKRPVLEGEVPKGETYRYKGKIRAKYAYKPNPPYPYGYVHQREQNIHKRQWLKLTEDDQKFIADEAQIQLLKKG